MLYFKKTFPSPSSLSVEKNKLNGNYKCQDVLDLLKSDFKNKCYLCEDNEITTINIEHFIPHKGDKELMFNWDNLFWSCGHCNNTKLAKYNDLLNCTNKADNVEKSIKIIMEPYPMEDVFIEIKIYSKKAVLTAKLLNEIYNGTTIHKKLESHNLRKRISKEVYDFQQNLVKYYEVGYSEEDRKMFLANIKRHLNAESAFTSIKRWKIRSNKNFLKDFGKYLL